MALGNITVNSLLRSANAAREKRISYEDATAAQEWNLSAKTEDDFLKYQDYLNNRAQQVETTDPRKALSYQNTGISARRSFVGHEIQRNAIAMLQGDTDLQTKYNLLVDYARAAQNIGDLDLAQSLVKQASSVDVQIQNEREAAGREAQRLADQMAKQQVFDFEQLADSYLTGDNDLTRPDTVPSIKQLAAEFSAGGPDAVNTLLGETNYWDAVATLMESSIEALTMAAEVAPTDSTKRRLLKEAEKIRSGEGIDIAPGVDNLNLVEVYDVVDAERAGQSIYSTTVTAGGKNEFDKTQQTGFTWGVDENGNTRLINLRGRFGTETFTLEGRGEISVGANEEFRQLLEATGLRLVSAEGDGVEVVQTDQSRFRVPGIQPGQAFRVFVTPEGRLRFANELAAEGGRELFELDLAEGVNATLREVEITPETAALIESLETGQPTQIPERQTFAFAQLLSDARDFVVDQVNGVFTDNQQQLFDLQDLIQRQRTEQLEVTTQPGLPVTGLQADRDLAGQLQAATDRAIQKSVQRADDIKVQKTAGIDALRSRTQQRLKVQAPREPKVGLKVAKPKKQPKVKVAPTPIQPKVVVR